MQSFLFCVDLISKFSIYDYLQTKELSEHVFLCVVCGGKVQVVILIGRHNYDLHTSETMPRGNTPLVTVSIIWLRKRHVQWHAWLWGTGKWLISAIQQEVQEIQILKVLRLKQAQTGSRNNECKFLIFMDICVCSSSSLYSEEGFNLSMFGSYVWL